MFTVKVVEEAHNSEVVFEAKQVRCGLDLPEGPGARRVWCDLEGGGQVIYDVRQDRPTSSGAQTMFVMNRFGATVAKYDL